MEGGSQHELLCQRSLGSGEIPSPSSCLSFHNEGDHFYGGAVKMDKWIKGLN